MNKIFEDIKSVLFNVKNDFGNWPKDIDDLIPRTASK